MNFEPYPNFEEFSDARLDLEQKLVEEKITWADTDGDGLLKSYYENEMRLLQAERARRNGGTNSYNSSNSSPQRQNPSSSPRRFMGWSVKSLKRLAHTAKRTQLPF